MNKLFQHIVIILGLLVLGSFGLAACQQAAANNNAARALKIEAWGTAIYNTFAGLGITILSTVPIVAIVAVVAMVLGILAIKSRSQSASSPIQVIERKTVVLLPGDISRRELFERYGGEMMMLKEGEKVIDSRPLS